MENKKSLKEENAKFKNKNDLLTNWQQYLVKVRRKGFHLLQDTLS